MKLLFAILAVCGLVFALVAPSTAATTTTKHYIANEEGQYSTTTGLGYNVHDVSSQSALNELPAGTQGLYWTGLGRCPTTPLPLSFKNFVRANATNDKLYGYFISDEPQNATINGVNCVAGLKAEVGFVHRNAPGKQTMIVLSQPSVYATFNTPNTGVNLIGLDPYPCNNNINGCDFTKVTSKVNSALAAGIKRWRIVPVFELFGDSYYKFPTDSELNQLLATWHSVVPNPKLDYSYTWGCQSSLTDCLSTHSSAQTIMSAHNG